MKVLLAVFQFVFGCRHRHLSRVFTIKHRTTRFASTVDGNSTRLMLSELAPRHLLDYPLGDEIFIMHAEAPAALIHSLTS
jgi:hypothetical protein